MARNRDSAFKKDRSFNIFNPIMGSNTSGVFRMTRTSIDKYKSNLYTLLFTSVGERVMMPNYGTLIRKYLFEPLDDSTFKRIREDILDKTRIWIPEIGISDISFANSEEDIENNKLTIRIDIFLKRDSTIQDFIEIETRV